MRTNLPLLLALVTLQTPVRAQSPTPVPGTTPEAPVVASESSPPTAEENAQILEKFAKAQKDFDVRKKDIANTALAKFTSGALSEDAAVQLYFTCEQILRDRLPALDGQTRPDLRERQEQMKQAAEQISASPGYAAMLQLQLQYLVLTMEAPGFKDRGALISRLKDFAIKAVGLVKMYSAPPADSDQSRTGGKGGSASTRREMEKRREMQQDERSRRQVLQISQQGAMGSVFAQAYNLHSYFKPMEGWPDSPLAIANAYNGMILPYYRENKKEFLGPAWDDYLNLEATLQRCAMDDRGYARWGMGAYKNLQWSKWMDLLRNGVNRVMAADELAKLCSENPTHPSVGGWIEQLATEMQVLSGGSEKPSATEQALQ